MNRIKNVNNVYQAMYCSKVKWNKMSVSNQYISIKIVQNMEEMAFVLCVKSNINPLMEFVAYSDKQYIFFLFYPSNILYL